MKCGVPDAYDLQIKDEWAGTCVHAAEADLCSNQRSFYECSCTQICTFYYYLLKYFACNFSVFYVTV